MAAAEKDATKTTKVTTMKIKNLIKAGADQNTGGDADATAPSLRRNKKGHKASRLRALRFFVAML